jgi:hypothetical protein
MGAGALNCKQGDLALVIGGRNVGKVVTCLELLPTGSEYVDEAVGLLWRVDRPLEYLNEALGMTANKYLAPDRLLMPLKPDRTGNIEALELGTSESLELR